MTRGTRMLLVFLLLIGTIGLMMDCAKKSLKKKNAHKPVDGNSHSQIFPRNILPQTAYARYDQFDSPWRS